MVRIVLDTNILVSGLLYPGKPRRLIDLAVLGMIEIVSSTEMIAELRDVLSREKFGLSKEGQASMVDYVIGLSHMTALKSKFKVINDPDDDKVITLAYDGKAGYIVSGDHHLLDLKEFFGIKIIKASRMLEIIG